jgi:hypothetical protein
MQALDRRWIYLVVALSITIPLLIPFNSKTYVTEPTENLYKMIDSFANKSDKAILLSVMHDASTIAELLPMEVSILRHAFERNVKVFLLCFMPESAPIIDYAINIVKEDFPHIQSGVHYLNFGYKPWGLFLPIVLGMGEDISEAVDTDSEGRKISSLPIMEDIRNYDDMNLIIDFSASGSVYSWITYARVRFGANVAAGITAVMAADNYPYLQSGQLIGMLSGLKGAAEYEKLVDVFASKQKSFSSEEIKVTWVDITDPAIPYKYKTARIGMNAQSVAHIMMIVFIIFGNIGFFYNRKKNKA